MMLSKEINYVYIVILTTLSNEDDKNIYQKIGADAFIPKPITRNNIQEAL